MAAYNKGGIVIDGSLASTEHHRIGLGRFGVLYMNEVFCNACHQITPLGEFKIKLTPNFNIYSFNFFSWIAQLFCKLEPNSISKQSIDNGEGTRDSIPSFMDHSSTNCIHLNLQKGGVRDAVAGVTWTWCGDAQGSELHRCLCFANAGRVPVS